MKEVIIKEIPVEKTKLYVRFPARHYKKNTDYSRYTKPIAYTDLVPGQYSYPLPSGITQIKRIYFK